MSVLSFDKSPQASKVWIALRRLDKRDEKVSVLREVSVPSAADVTIIIQIIRSAFGLNCSNVVFKIRNHRGRLIPLNSSIPANSKHVPYVLEVAKLFQHVCPKLRTIPMTVINKTMKTRLQTIERRIQRLEDLLPQIKLRHNEKLTQEIESLNQKLRFLHQRMQVANSHTWKGMLTRAPLW
ncbi:uncharacterized protein LOC115800999 isoform X2 [Archocentrus centrarchus]|uniref:uncharacterized protein LOC115800999 isoform X2 n=1 Tax=Archocentrus centrarchus TaxID=63155 RepID=UPI0011E9FAB4|nr:uncharacterized protein LOC115800999 isoform X2 [Archocentrus centrarchus]